MSAGTQIDWSKYETKPAGQTAPPKIDFTKYGTSTGSTATDAFSKATSISARPPENWFQQRWDEIKQGWAGANPGAGLPQQPTALGNAAEFARMTGDTASFLGLGPGMAKGASAIGAAIPSTERAGQTFQALKGAIGNHTVAVTDRLADTLSEIKQAADTGSTLPSVINKFVTRIADVEKGPLTYEEARQFYSNVSDLSATERMAARSKDLRLLQLFKHALGDTISQTAESAGRLEQYQGAMKEFAQAKNLEGTVEAAKEVAKKAAIRTAIGAAAGAGGYGAYRVFSDIFGQ